MRYRVSLLAGLVVLSAMPATAQNLQVYAPACNGGYSAELLALGDQRVLRIVGPQPYRGDVTLYGIARRYRASIDSGADPNLPFVYPVSAQTVIVRAQERIEAASFRPANATCDVNAVAAPPGLANVTFMAARELTASDDGPLPAAACDVPFRPAAVVAATEPDTPAMAQQQGITGRVILLVGLDETGRVTSARVYRSPSAMLNASSIAAARSSRYRPAVLRCNAVPSTIPFAVDYMRQ